ncbi:hypothetical protein GGR57DRAFT_497458 [Xylariaceae sp. FL1272]|nr:hypothetical protein GGR57DRAFT_497458 [Xylariaceae sp. FL1272]
MPASYDVQSYANKDQYAGQNDDTPKDQTPRKDADTKQEKPVRKGTEDEQEHPQTHEASRFPTNINSTNSSTSPTQALEIPPINPPDFTEPFEPLTKQFVYDNDMGMPLLNIPLFRYPLEDPREWYTRIEAENTRLETRRQYIIRMLYWIKQGDIAHREHLDAYRKEGNPNLLIAYTPEKLVTFETETEQYIPEPHQVVEPRQNPSLIERIPRIPLRIIQSLDRYLRVLAPYSVHLILAIQFAGLGLLCKLVVGALEVMEKGDGSMEVKLLPRTDCFEGRVG